MNFKRILPMALSLLVATSSLQMVGMSATIHPAAMQAAMATTAPQPVQVTVNGQSSSSSNGYGLLHIAVGTLAVSTAALGFIVYKNGRALRRIMAQQAITNNNMMRLDARTQERFNHLTQDVRDLNSNIQASHAHLTEQTRYANANNVHMLQQINPQIQPLTGAPQATVQFHAVGNHTLPAANLQALPDQSALDRALNLVDQGLNSGFGLLFSAPGVMIRIATNAGKAMANPETRLLFADY